MEVLQKSHVVANAVIGQGNTKAWKLCGLDKNTCLTVFFDVSSTDKSEPDGTIPHLFIQFLTRYMHAQSLVANPLSENRIMYAFQDNVYRYSERF